MKSKTIEIKCITLETLNLEEFVPFQGNLKELDAKNYKRLKKIILTHGFCEPISVWKHDDKNYILNGHQRVRTLHSMQKEGYTIPPLPVNFLEAKDEKDAKLKVLALTSQYGKMTDETLHEFTYDLDLEPGFLEDHFRFPEIEFHKFEANFEEKQVEPKEDLTEKNVVFVVCKDENEQEELFEELNERGFECKII